MEVKLLAITPDAERVIEEAGRTCYLSFEKISAESAQKFVRMLVRSGHHSVLEHASATFRIKGGSRAFTHQLVRHRLFSFSQQSQRYVGEEEFNYIVPDSIQNNPEANALYLEYMKQTQEVYKKLLAMEVKKEDARFILPNAIESEIVVSGNFREWRHFFEARGDSHAQWEIRRIAMELLRELKKHAPTVFEDFVMDEEKEIIMKTSEATRIH